MVCEMGGKWPYTSSFVESRLDKKGDYNLFVHFLTSFFSKYFVDIQLVQPYNSTENAPAWRKFCYILPEIRFSYGR